MRSYFYIISGWMLLVSCAGPTRAAEALLADAAESNQPKAVRELLERKTDIHAVQADGMTALHWTAYHDDAACVKLLLTAGADAKVANRYGVTPLSIACTNGSETIINQLLEAGADANTTLPGGETALMTAARTGRLGPVKTLLAHKANFNARERQGQTALMWAAAEGHLEVVEALLEAGANYRTPLPSGFTPLFFAVREGHAPVVFRLLKLLSVNDAMRPTHGGKAFSPLLLAIENGHFGLAAALLDAGADPNDQPAGYAALHAITWVRKPIRGDGDPPPRGSGELSSLDLVRKLADHRADVNIRLHKGDSGRGKFTTTGSTPFLLAARTGDIALLKVLLELKADPKLMNADHSPPLLAAAGVGALADGDEAAATEDEAVDAVKFLLDLGADIDAVDDNGETAMHGAAYQSLPKVVKLLADRQANVRVWHQKNKWNWTPLMIAEGHRPANFRPAPDTITAIEKALLAAGMAIPSKVKANNRPDY
jgi:ankyrin repeat protein